MLTRRRGAPGTGSLPRCLAVWVAAGLVLVTLLRALAPDLIGAPALLATSGRAGVPFDALVTVGCAALLAGCAAWAWLVVTADVLEAVGGRPRLDRGCPASVRRWVLAACGVALAAGAAPATAAGGHDGAVGAARGPGVEDRSVLAGLPMPDLAVGPPQRTGPAPWLRERAPRDVLVRPGDTLWDLAAGDLPAVASPAAVDRHWRLLWQVNRAAIGPDPNTIRPGTSLRLPPREDAR